MRFYLVTLSLVGLFSFFSCQKEDDNGALGGFWQLRSIEYYLEGREVNMEDSLRFMSVQLNLLELRNTKTQRAGSFGRFSLADDSLRIEMIGTVKAGFMELFGMKGVNPSFEVERLNRNCLILKSDFSRLQFKKY